MQKNIVEKQVIVICQLSCLMDKIEAVAEANVSLKRVLHDGEIEAGLGDGLARHCHRVLK